MRSPSYIIIALACSLFASLGVLPRFPEAGLDQSWQQALCDATDTGRIFGKDVVFTYGPLHQVATHQVSMNMTPFVLGRLVFGIAWFCTGLLFCVYFGGIAGGILLLGIIVLNARTGWPEAQSDVMIYLLSILFLIIGFKILTSRKSPSFTHFIMLLLSGAGVAISPLIKLSFLTSTLPTLFGVIVISFIRILFDRSLKSYLFSFLLVFFLLLSLILVWSFTTRSNINDLLVFLTGPNIDIVKGYAAAMSTSPRYGTAAFEILLYFYSFISIGLIFISLNENSFLSAYSNSKIHFFSAVLVFFLLAALSWVFFKVGFVRHKTQAITPGMILVGLWFMVVSLNWKNLIQLLKAKGRIMILPSLVSPLLIGFLIAVANGYLPSIKKGSFEYLCNFPKTLYSIFTPTGLESLRNSREDALVNLSTETENFKIESNSNAKVDIFPWDITDVLVNGLNYHPRPIPQSYSAYTKNLQITNLRHFQNSNSRPDYVIIRLGDIDDRLPIGLDSISLRYIFSNYQLTHRGSNNSLVFKSSKIQEEEIVRERIEGDFDWHRAGNLLFESSSLSINSHDSFIWLTSDLEPTPLNKLLSFLFKPFPTFIEYLDESGSVIFSARIIPSAITSILIYPLVLKNEDFFIFQNDQIKQVRLASRFFFHPFSKANYLLEITAPPKFTLMSNSADIE